ncbi:MAG: hypothetical protein EHM85_03315 [Desulfobacteraceae bacterium]|nr:MAG: hypothetical protein EHM85_03315 [Desulfobacteraceae bacterium]
MDDFMDDSFDNDNSFDDNPDGNIENDDGLNGDMLDSSDNDDTIDIGWQEIAMLGALSEEIADDERERLRIEREMNKQEDEENL